VSYRRFMKERSLTGFTLVEVVVAILVLAVGVLALAGTTAVTVRRMSQSGRLAAAASVARSRAESSFSQSCTAVTSGSERLFNLSSEWSASVGMVATDLTHTVTFAAPRGDHTDSFLTAAPCF
jgi:prepilin-type N-terminal cleavage/methylation domain-containing protein